MVVVAILANAVLDCFLDVEDWQQFREELTGELHAARAEAKRLFSQEQDVRQWAELRDAEEKTWRRLAEIQAVIAGEVREAGDLDADRAGLQRTFDRFVLRRTVPRVHVELIANSRLVIEPVVRQQAIQGYSESLRPILRREPLEAGSRDHLE
jgi:hypothetical protein